MPSDLPTDAPWWPRFSAKVAEPDANGCRLWTAARDPNGYGRFWHDGNMQLAHRVLLIASTGPPSRYLEVDHVCNVRACVSLDHLRWLDHRANSLRGTSPPARNARRTTCNQGHPLDGVRGDGSRYCLTCNRDRVARYTAKRRASAAS